MIIPVRMLAHHNVNTVRPVYVPSYNHETVEDLLDNVYKYGQNDFVCGPSANEIRKTICSLDVGDVIELPDGSRYLVAPMGFYHLTNIEYNDYKAASKDDRWMICREFKT